MLYLWHHMMTCMYVCVYVCMYVMAVMMVAVIAQVARGDRYSCLNIIS
jgi:hypothetical protein